MYSEGIILDSIDENSVVPVKQYAQGYKAHRIVQHCNHYIIKNYDILQGIDTETITSALSNVELQRPPQPIHLPDIALPPTEALDAMGGVGMANVPQVRPSALRVLFNCNNHSVTG